MDPAPHAGNTPKWNLPRGTAPNDNSPPGSGPTEPTDRPAACRTPNTKTETKSFSLMKYAFSKWLTWFCVVLFAGGLATSCSQMHEDLDDCPYGLYLSFQYDYNLQRADMFSDHVGAVTVYVFDQDGRYVTKQEETNVGTYRPLASPLYQMHMNLEPGTYKFLVLAGQKGYDEQLAGNGARFVRTEPAAGDSLSALRVQLETLQEGETFRVVNNGLPLDTLWHGMLLEEVEVSNTRPTYKTISLVRDTKKINVTLRELDDPTKMDIANYEMHITDHNDRIRWDNSLDEGHTVVYTPHQTWNTEDSTPAFDVSGNPIEGVGRMAHADFMTSRILYHGDAARDAILSVTNRETGVEVIRVNLPDLLSRLRTSEDIYRYEPQEFLDRGYDYQLEFFLKGDRLAYVNISISILGWAQRIQFEEL